MTQHIVSSQGIRLNSPQYHRKVETNAMNIQQSPAALDGLWIVYALVPVIGMILSAFCYMGYKLNDKDVQIMAKCNAGEIPRSEAEKLLSRKY